MFIYVLHFKSRNHSTNCIINSKLIAIQFFPLYLRFVSNESSAFNTILIIGRQLEMINFIKFIILFSLIVYHSTELEIDL